MRSKTFILCTLYSVLCTLCLEAQDLLHYPLDTINGEEVYIYQVEKSIGLYRIGVNFDVPQSEIVRLNPQLRERGLHYGEKLRIPTGRPVIIETKPEIVETIITIDTVIHRETLSEAVTGAIHVVDSMVSVSRDTVIPEYRDTVMLTDSIVVADTIVPDPRRVIELALMLPFESHQTKRSANGERMMEFYQGVLLALREAQNDSTLYRLRVYDTERSERRVATLCDSTELDSVRGIIGLAYPIQIDRMSTWCQAHQIPLFLPFSDDVDLRTNPYLLQFNSTEPQKADSLCRWILSRDSITHCVAVDVREAELSVAARTLRREMRAQNIHYKTLPLRDLMMDSAAYALDTARENLIILHSDKWQHARLLIPHLQTLQRQGYKIRLLSQYSWQKESIALPQVYTSVFTGDTDRAAYESAWRTYFLNEHVSDTPRFDLLGYDLTRALMAWLNGEQQSTGLQSDIRWQRVNEFGGWQNASTKVVNNE
ncbi:MAG: hypothetical protein IJS82_06165 [Paludibacteraceae bacterium]|nr:hypothetical protein [Paludibacteraceae bacterium]